MLIVSSAKEPPPHRTANRGTAATDSRRASLLALWARALVRAPSARRRRPAPGVWRALSRFCLKAFTVLSSRCFSQLHFVVLRLSLVLHTLCSPPTRGLSHSTAKHCLHFASDDAALSSTISVPAATKLFVPASGHPRDLLHHRLALVALRRYPHVAALPRVPLRRCNFGILFQCSNADVKWVKHDELERVNQGSETYRYSSVPFCSLNKKRNRKKSCWRIYNWHIGNNKT